jgi:hypothetical protein
VLFRVALSTPFDRPIKPGYDMTEKMVTVAVFVSPHEAGMAKGELEAYGIPAYVADEFAIGANPLLSNALGGIKVKVPVGFVEEARKVLSVESTFEAGDDANAGQSDNPQKMMAKSFVWLYLITGAAATAFVVYISMKLHE